MPDDQIIERRAQPETATPGSAEALPVGATIPGEQVIRGALRVEMSTSSTDLQAGRIFSLFVTITNPFDIPVQVENVTAIIPVEFVDLVTTRRRNLLDASRGPDSAFVGRVTSSIKKMLAQSQDSQDQVAKAVTDDTNIDNGTTQRQGLSSTILQPGDRGTQHFSLRTRSWLLFQPAAYELPVHIVFRLGGKLHRDTVTYRLSIRSPFRAIIWGAVVGAIAGSLLHDITVDKKLELGLQAGQSRGWFLLFFLSILGSILASILTVVAFARKRDAQPFITVEDFWGGVFVGTVVGYGGKSLLERMLNVGAPGPSPHG